jgi:Na+/serine symporter
MSMSCAARFNADASHRWITLMKRTVHSVRSQGHVMKPVTVDMLRAHLLVASLTAAGAEAVLCVALLVLPMSQHFFGSMSFRLLSVAVIAGGVIVAREFAQAAFAFAVARHYATAVNRSAWPVEFEVAPDCPRRWLVILHLRLTGKPFVLAGH